MVQVNGTIKYYVCCCAVKLATMLLELVAFLLKVLGKSEKFDELMAAAAEEREVEDGLERVPTTGVCCCANSSIFTGLNKVNQICNVAGTFVILDVTHDILYYYVCD